MKICQIWLPVIESVIPNIVVNNIPKIGYAINSQSLNILYQLIIRKKLKITWKLIARFLLNIQYEIIANKHENEFVILSILFLLIDIDNKVKPIDRKE